jgi:dienelactone hydrolase
MKLTVAFSLVVAAFALPPHSPVAAQEMPPAPQDAARIAAATASAEAGGSGAMLASMASESGLPGHTIYRPRDLEAAMAHGRLPIVVFGNGACANIGNRYRYLLTEIASHGYLVIANGPIGPADVEWRVNLGEPGAEPPAQRAPQSTAAQLTDAIDWAIAENARPGSDYRGRLDTQAIAVMGQSCGGLQAIAASADRRVTTTVVLNSGTFPAGSPPLGGTGDATKASLARLHGPVAWISGDESDIAHVNAGADFAAIASVPAMWAWHEGTGHSDHYRMANGGHFAPVIEQWLAWQLKGMRAAGATFTGADCSLCTAPGWHVAVKDF